MHQDRWEKVKATFALLVEQPPDARARLLDELCIEDDALRQEVASLLESHDDTSQTLQPPWRSPGASSIPNEADYAGKAFGRYRIVRELGRGGMGAVFLAERADGAFHQLVALKVARWSFVDSQRERRFLRERQILASLNHPHIAHLLDGGVSEGGEPFLVMEYVEGDRIDEYCRRAGLATRDRLKLFLRVCRAVGHAHDQSVIHRDLKPSNILVTRDGVPKLLDFGIARLLDATGAHDHTVTEFRAFTPAYAAPEQVRGEGPVTPATDVYSLGVLLALILGITEPGEAGAGPASDAESRSSTHRAPAAGNRELENIVTMARRAEPRRRYQTARELAEDIERYLDGLPVRAQPDSLAYRASKFVARHGLKVGAGTMVVTALCAGILIARLPGTAASSEGPARIDGRNGGTRGANPLANVKSIAVLPLRSLGDGGSGSNPPQRDQALRVGMTDSIVTRLGQVRDLAVRPTSATVRYLDQDVDAAAVGRELRVDVVLEGSVVRAGTEIRTTFQLVDTASGQLAWADSIVSDLANVLHGQASLANRVSQLLALNLRGTPAHTSASAHGTTNIEAQDAFLAGNLALATSVRQVSNIFAARDGFEQAIRLDPNFALALAGLANAYSLAGSLNLLAPQDSYPKAERAARRALELDPDSAVAYIALAEVEADYNWNWAAAEANHRRAIELAPNLAPAHQSYAEFLARMGRFGESARHGDLAQQLDPTRINYAAVRALHYYYEHRYGDAIAQAERTISRDATAYLAYLYLSVAHASVGNFPAGLDAGRKAMALTGGAIPDQFVLGCNYALMDDRARANEILRRLRAMDRERFLDPFHVTTIYAYLGDRGRAFEWLERSYRQRSYWMTTLKVHPVVDSLRGDPRFGEMMKRMGLE